MSTISDDLRAIGFTDKALNHPRSGLAHAMICAFCGYDPAKAPKGLGYFPNENTKKAWERVEDACRQWFATETQSELERAVESLQQDDPEGAELIAKLRETATIRQRASGDEANRALFVVSKLSRQDAALMARAADVIEHEEARRERAEGGR